MGPTPIEPEPSPWVFPDPTDSDSELIVIGGDLSPGSLLAAYRSGYFPMPFAAETLDLKDDESADLDLPESGVIGWWSPDPRGILEFDDLRVSRSLRRSIRRYRVTFDQAFERVMRGCADPQRDGGWINEAFIAAYCELHALGWARSVEVWTESGDDLVGGLYGVSIGRFFAGESMFSRQVDASKVALVALIEELASSGGELVDVQWCTEHLSTLGVTEISREAYLRRLRSALMDKSGRYLGHSNDSP